MTISLPSDWVRFSMRLGGQGRKSAGPLVALCLLAGQPALGQTAAPVELRLRRWAEIHHDEQIATLERLVNIQSGTMNPAGVRAAGDLVRRTLDSLGFT